MKKTIFFPLLLFIFLRVGAQVDLTYYLPDIQYDQSVPTPESFLGYQIGEWHIHHPLSVQYMQLIAETSDRAMIYEYGRSHQQRPLVHLVITSEENMRNIESIRENHLALTEPDRSANLDISNMPAVVRLGYGVHGNEPSAHNAAPLIAYYFAAGISSEVNEILDNMVIIIDPSLNPDGQDRFASWVNRHKSYTLNPNPSDREFSDVWPGSRTNHYWFDLNRDWLPVQHPESHGRVKAYHNWMPNINTDHHEFGSNSTFFFQPGVPERVNPRTPQRTDDLTMDVAMFHAAAFDRIGQLYYTQQGFDDFYYGKGSTYPDVHGSIGILFEQASSRGHQRETIHGILDFSKTIKNQVVVSLSSVEAGLNMRETLLEHLRWFYTSAIEEANQEDFEAYIFGDQYDQGKNYHLLDILKTHQINFYEINESVQIDGETYSPGKSWVVPLKQRQYRLIQSMFEKVLEFEDSLFYDVSTWTKPLAFNMPYGKITTARQLNSIRGNFVEAASFPTGNVIGGKSENAYLFEWDEYYAPKALYYLQNNGLRTKVATNPFSMYNAEGDLVEFNYGTISIPVQTQELDPDRIYELMRNAAAETGITIHAVETSFAQEGIHLGSGSFGSLNKPEILLLIGSGTSSRDAGEVWHLLDQRYNIPSTKMELSSFNNTDLSRYNTIIMVSGSYGGITESGRDNLDRWLRGGGTIVALGTANRWLERNGFADFDYVSSPDIEEPPQMLPYSIRSNYYGARRISGTIFEAKLDTTHPIAYGYRNEMLPVYVSGTFAIKPEEGNPFSNPLIFTEDALLSGYVWEPYKDIVNNSAGVLVNSRGRGTIVTIVHNPNFRAFWFGNSKLFANGIFFGSRM